MTEWLGQNGEDRVIAAYLAEHHPTLVGRVLDIGAHDGWSLSNTARLLERGWGGTLVEASPRPLAKLIDRWGDREDITIVGACVTPESRQEGYAASGLVAFYDDAGAACHGGEAFLGTTEAANVAKWQSATRFRRVMLVETTIGVVIQQTKAPGSNDCGRFDVVSVDVEGTSVDLLRELHLGGMGALVVVVEHDDRIPDVVEYVEKHGMRVAHINAENVIAVRA